MSLRNKSEVVTISGPEFINLSPLDINPLMSECEIKKIVPEKDSKGAVIGIRFEQNNDIFQYNYEDEKIKK